MVVVIFFAGLITMAVGLAMVIGGASEGNGVVLFLGIPVGIIGVVILAQLMVPGNDVIRKQGLENRIKVADVIEYAKDKDATKIVLEVNEPPTFYKGTKKLKTERGDFDSKILGFIPFTDWRNYWQDVTKDHLFYVKGDTNPCELSGIDEDDYSSCEWLGRTELIIRLEDDDKADK